MSIRAAQRRAFTLIELIATMLVLGVAAAAIVPLLINLTDASRAAQHRYVTIDTLHHAIDRTARLLREAPPGPTGGIELSEVTSAGFELPDGRSIELLADTLWLDPGDGSTWPLADGLTAFSLTYFESDGVTPTTDPAAIQRVGVRIERDSMTLTTVVFFRTAEASP